MPGCLGAWVPGCLGCLGCLDAWGASGAWSPGCMLPYSALGEPWVPGCGALGDLSAWCLRMPGTLWILGCAMRIGYLRRLGIALPHPFRCFRKKALTSPFRTPPCPDSFPKTAESGRSSPQTGHQQWHCTPSSIIHNYTMTGCSEIAGWSFPDSTPSQRRLPHSADSPLPRLSHCGDFRLGKPSSGSAEARRF